MIRTAFSSGEKRSYFYGYQNLFWSGDKVRMSSELIYAGREFNDEQNRDICKMATFKTFGWRMLWIYLNGFGQ